MTRISLEGLIARLAGVPEVVNAEIEHGMKKAAVKVRDEATKKFGSYQPAVGPFPGWALLTFETLRRKMDLGGSPGPDPLIGHYEGGRSVWPTNLRNTLEIEIDGLQAQVGTHDPLGSYHEFGTSRGIPPRPFLRPALFENEDYVKECVKSAIAEVFKNL